MKKIKLALAATFILLFTLSMAPVKSTAQVAVSFQVFYDNLSPYGSWVTYPAYGYVWVPSVGTGFRPYVTGGHWVYSDAGWVWVSDYDWGWAPFHYGSWIDDPGYGWVWVPGYDWAPAWVTWGSYNGYYGWAPVGPGFSIGVGYSPPINNWCFVEPRYMVSGNWGSHCYLPRGNQIVINNNIVINNVQRISTIRNTNNFSGRAYNAGPARQDFQRVARTTVTPVSVREASAPGRTQVASNSVNIYRPHINPGTKVASRPAQVASADQVRAARTTPGANNGGQRNDPSRQSSPASNHQAPSNPAPNNGRVANPAAMQQHATQANMASSSHQRNVNPQRQVQRNTAPQTQQHAAPPQIQRSSTPAQRPQSAPQAQRNAPTQRPQAPAHIQQRAAAPQQRQAPQMQRQAAPQAAPQHEAAPQGGGEERGGRGPRFR